MHCFSPIFLLSLVLATFAGTANAGELRQIKLQDSETGTRAVLELDGVTAFKYFTLHNPERLVVDLKNSRSAPGFKLPAGVQAITTIRTGSPAPDTLRVVFDLAREVEVNARSEVDGAVTRVQLELANPGKSFARSQGVPPASSSIVANIDATLPAKKVIPASVPVALPEIDAPAPTQTLPTTRNIVEPDTRGASVAPNQTTESVALVPEKTMQDVLASGQRKLIVAIDAGHGGKDPGAHGPTGVHEKVVTLALARDFARLVNADPGMTAVMIRDNDSFVALPDRYMKARAAQADIFVSIHADASPNHSASGASVFVLSTRGASSQAARWLADQENSADLVGGVTLDEKDHNLAAVLLDLSQSATMRASDDVANEVLAALKQVGKAHKPNVERANFVVLRSPDVPSMLIETGFISNPDEEKRLADPDYRRRLATAIADGVRQYFIDQPPPGSWYAAQTDRRPASRQHVVSRGETLSLIAAQHGVGMSSIRQANGLHGDTVRIGARLTIPLAAMPK